MGSTTPREGTVLDDSFFGQGAELVARELLGSLLLRRVGGVELVARIVETEAYLGAPDRASHGWNGRHTKRNHSLYLSGGHTYVYFVYGMHHCFNVVTGAEGRADAVLVRAAEPVTGVETMRRLRGRAEPLLPGDLLGGPAKLCQALAIDRRLDGARLPREDLSLLAGPRVSDEQLVCGARIGVGYAQEAVGWPLRFALRDHPAVSRPRPTEELEHYRIWRHGEPFAVRARPPL